MVRVFIPDNSVTTGAGCTGLTYASTNLAVAYSRELDNGGTEVTGANILDITTIGTWQDPGAGKVRFKAVDATKMPGLYEIHFPDAAAFGTADASQHIIVNVYEKTTTALKIGPNMVLIPLSSLTVLDGESNIVAISDAMLLRLGIVAYGTAQSATGTTLRLASAATFADDELNGCIAVITGGSAGVGQARQITDYVGSTDTATVDVWTTTPTGTISYVIFAAAPASATALPKVDVTAISGDSTAADNLESACDGTTYNIGGGAVVAASVTGAVGSVTGAVGSVTGAVGSVTGAVGSVTGAVGSLTGAAVKKNVALAKFSYVMRDNTNHQPVTGKTVTCTRSIDGGAFGAGTLANVAELSNGVYLVDFALGDLNGAVITLRCTASGCDDTFVTLVTTP